MSKILKKQDFKTIYRIIDVNINRLKEGLRVCEDICRFFLNDINLTYKFKRIRHRVDKTIGFFPYKHLIKFRDIETDVGKKTLSLEKRRKDFKNIFFANIQRLKESLRVLEEFSKILNLNLAEEFKKIRYKIYDLEIETFKRFSKSLRNLRYSNP